MACTVTRSVSSQYAASASWDMMMPMSVTVVFLLYTDQGTLFYCLVLIRAICILEYHLWWVNELLAVEITLHDWRWCSSCLNNSLNIPDCVWLHHQTGSWYWCWIFTRRGQIGPLAYKTHTSRLNNSWLAFISACYWGFCSLEQGKGQEKHR